MLLPVDFFIGIMVYMGNSEKDETEATTITRVFAFCMNHYVSKHVSMVTTEVAPMNTHFLSFTKRIGKGGEEKINQEIIMGIF